MIDYLQVGGVFQMVVPCWARSLPSPKLSSKFAAVIVETKYCRWPLMMRGMRSAYAAHWDRLL